MALLERGLWPKALPRRVEHGLGAAAALAAASTRLPALGTRQNVLQARIVGGGGAINAMLWCRPTDHDIVAGLGHSYTKHVQSYLRLVEGRVAAPPPPRVVAAWAGLVPEVVAQARRDAPAARQDARGLVRATRISCVAGRRQSPAQLLLETTAEAEAAETAAAQAVASVVKQAEARSAMAETASTPAPASASSHVEKVTIPRSPISSRTGGNDPLPNVPLRAAAEAIAAAAAAASPHSPLRPGVDLVPGVEAESIELDSEGRATAVLTADGRRFTGRRGIILAGGAIETPALLLRSGIGPPDVLQRAGLPCRHALEGVGQNLSDHVLLNDYAVLHPTERVLAAPAAAEYDMPFQVHDAVGNAVQLSVSRLVDDPLAWKLFAEFRYPVWRLARVAARRYMRVQLKLTNDAARGRVVLNGRHRPQLDMSPTLSHARRHRDDLVSELVSLQARMDTLVEAGGARLESVFRETLLRRPADYLWSGYHYAGTCGVGTVLEEETMAVKGLEGLYVADPSAANVTSTGNSQALAYFCGHACGERLAETV